MLQEVLFCNLTWVGLTVIPLAVEALCMCSEAYFLAVALLLTLHLIPHNG